MTASKMSKPHEQFANLSDLLWFATKGDEFDYYLKMDELQDGYIYKIIARNAYVGIWNQKNSSFIISRRKVSDKPFLFEEFHWDFDSQLGTAKPLELIEEAPFSNYENEEAITSYLEALERKYPLIEGFDTVSDRQASAANYRDHLSGKKLKQNRKRSMLEFVDGTDGQIKYSLEVEFATLKSEIIDDIETVNCLVIEEEYQFASLTLDEQIVTPESGRKVYALHYLEILPAEFSILEFVAELARLGFERLVLFVHRNKNDGLSPTAKKLIADWCNDSGRVQITTSQS